MTARSLDRLPDALACVTALPALHWRAPGTSLRPDVNGVFGTNYFVPWSIPDPREAWEALQTRGLAPPDDVRRVFACERCGGDGVNPEVRGGPRNTPYGCPVCDTDGTLDCPSSVAVCLALAADPGGLLSAEELAREAARAVEREWRVMPSRRTSAGRIVWRVGVVRTREMARDRGWFGVAKHIDEDLARLGYECEPASTTGDLLLTCPRIGDES